MKLPHLLCLLCLPVLAMEESTSGRITPYQYLYSDWSRECKKDLSADFPCDPGVIETIKKNLKHIPGYDSGNEFDWLPEYKIRQCCLDEIIGAAIIRKCTLNLGLNLVSAPDKRLANIKRAELEVYNEACGNYFCPYRSFIVQRRIPSTNAGLTLAQVQQLCELIRATGYETKRKENIINGTDGIVYFDNTSYLRFSQAKTQESFNSDVHFAMIRLRKNHTLEASALAWLNKEIDGVNA